MRTGVYYPSNYAPGTIVINTAERRQEISSADLSSLLIRLRRSVALVQEAMRHLPDQHVQDTP
jgi:hypothetical protein